MSDSDMRAMALEKAVEVCGRSNHQLVMGVAREFYRFLSNAPDMDIDSVYEKLRQGKP